MTWSSVLKVFSGFLVAIALIAGGGFWAAQYFIAQLTTPPPRPTFSNDNPAPNAKPAAGAAIPPAVPSPAPSPAASPVPSPVVSPKPSPGASPNPANGEYRAKITLSEGLNLRQAPSADADRVGGVDYAEEVTVLQESPDKEWIKIRVKSSGVEGWIKSGYSDRLP